MEQSDDGRSDELALEYRARARSLLSKSAIARSLRVRLTRGETLWPSDAGLDAALREELGVCS